MQRKAQRSYIVETNTIVTGVSLEPRSNYPEEKTQMNPITDSDTVET